MSCDTGQCWSLWGAAHWPNELVNLTANWRGCSLPARISFDPRFEPKAEGVSLRRPNVERERTAELGREGRNLQTQLQTNRT